MGSRKTLNKFHAALSDVTTFLFLLAVTTKSKSAVFEQLTQTFNDIWPLKQILCTMAKYSHVMFVLILEYFAWILGYVPAITNSDKGKSYRLLCTFQGTIFVWSEKLCLQRSAFCYVFSSKFLDYKYYILKPRCQRKQRKMFYW